MITNEIIEAELDLLNSVLLAIEKTLVACKPFVDTILDNGYGISKIGGVWGLCYGDMPLRDCSIVVRLGFTPDVYNMLRNKIYANKSVLGVQISALRRELEDV